VIFLSILTFCISEIPVKRYVISIKEGELVLSLCARSKANKSDLQCIQNGNICQGEECLLEQLSPGSWRRESQSSIFQKVERMRVFGSDISLRRKIAVMVQDQA